MKILTAEQVIFTVTGKGGDGVSDLKTSFALGEPHATIRCEMMNTDTFVPTDEYVVAIDQIPLLIEVLQKILMLRSHGRKRLE